MKLMKKLVASLFIFSLLLTILPMQMTTFAAEDHNARIKKLMDLGIYSVTDDMEYDTELIKRENMASILSVFYGVTEESCPEDTIFEDVSANWASGHIMAMVNNGIMNGYSDGLFRPMSYVTGDAAIKTLVSMAGYGFLAESKGGYPDGYRRMAAELGMLKGIENMNRAANITRGEFTTLLYNALDVPMLQQVTAGATNRFETDGTTTLLSFHLKIYREKGVITALPYVSAGLGEGAGAGKIHLDNVAYLCNLDAYPYLGEPVDVYFRLGEAGDLSEIIRIEHRVNASTSVTVAAENILSYNNFKFTYTEKDREKSLTVPSDVLVIFNGKPMTYFSDAHMMPKQGNVRFCDADGDGVYEIAFVTYEVDYHVASVNRSSEFAISDVNGVSAGRPTIVIDKDDDSYHYSVYNAGQACDLEDIQTNEIISIAADSMDLTTGKILSSSTVYRIQRCETRAKGMVQGKSANEIIVDGLTSELSYSCFAMNKAISLGKTYTIYYNYLGKVADFDENVSTSKYGILIKAGTEGGVFSETTKVQIFTQDGRDLTTLCADNIQLDGYSKKSYDNALTYLRASSVAFGNTTGITVPENGVWQLIKYTENDLGHIASIDTVKTNLNPGESDLTHSSSTKTGSNTPTNGVVQSEVGEAHQRVRNTMHYDCVLFAYNTNKPLDDITNLYITTQGSLRTAGQEAHHFFDPDEIGAHYAMIRSAVDYNTKVNVEDRQSVILYLGDKQIVNSNGEQKDAIYGIKLTNGATQTLTLLDRSVLTNTGAQFGDIIQYGTNAAGEIDIIEVSLNIDVGGAMTSTTSPTYIGWAGRLDSYVAITCGVVRNRNSQYIRLESPTSITVGPKDFSQGSVTSTFQSDYLKTVIIYDRANNKARIGSVEDIRMADEYGYEAADLVAGYRSSGQMDTMILYR